MTTISETNSSPSLNLTSAVSGGSVLGKEDFLQLMVAQLQNQDPLNPSDATEFTSQLSQFSSLEQLMNINNTLGELSNANAKMEQLSALSLMGSDVVSDAGYLHFDGGPVSLGCDLEEIASDVDIHILDSSGYTVASLSVSNPQKGENFITWDGKDKNGLDLPSGDYSLYVSALGNGDEFVEASPLVRGSVQGVDLGGTRSTVITSAGNFALSDISSVRGQE